MSRGEHLAIGVLTVIAITTGWMSARGLYVSTTVPVPAHGGGYTEAVVGQMKTLNPLLAQSDPERAISHLIFSGLYRYSPSGELEPDLAAALPELSEDEKQYTVHLRPGLHWHDGTPVTSADVVFTIAAVKDPERGSPLMAAWQQTSAEAPDPLTVKFTTKDISGPFVHNLTLPILQQATWEQVQAKDFAISPKNLTPVGTGPYRVSSITRLPTGGLSSVVLQSVPEYFRGPARLESVTFDVFPTQDTAAAALSAKEVDGFGYTPNGPFTLPGEDRSGTTAVSLPLPQYQVAFLNLSSRGLSELAVRQALSLATDRADIAQRAYGGKAIAATGTMQTSAAVTQLDASGWTIDPKTALRSKKGTPLEVTILSNQTPANQIAAAALAETWRNLQIKVNVTTTTDSELTARIAARTYDVLVLPIALGADPDPFPFWHSSQVKNPGLNFSGFSNAKVDQLIAAARTTTNETLREQKYAELEKQIAEQVPAIYLSQVAYHYALPNELKGVSLTLLPDASYRTFDLPSWYLGEKRSFNASAAQ